MTDGSTIIKTPDNFIDLECRETFIKRDYNSNDSESLCIRIIRKKFKCIMLLLLIILLILQIVNTILSNLTKEDFNMYVKLLLSQKINKSDTNNFLSREYD
jgi:hypothetical protein